jgi:hypothetical protein
MSTKLYSIEYPNGYVVVIQPTQWMYRHGEKFLVEGVDCNGDTHAVTDATILAINVYYSDEDEQKSA